MTILETERLVLRRLTTDDAAFVLGLLNQPSYLRFIGDKGVRTLDDARDYLLKGPIDSYERHGHGLYLAVLKDGGVPIGMCGLLRRPGLDDVDVGYALLPQFWSKGYAFEAASAVMAYGRDTLRLERIVAIVSPENGASIRILEKLGLTFSRTVRLPGDGAEVQLFAPRDGRGGPVR
ncbi:MAG TPA: GNAT family N-acetyltransferase [Longimicrobiales bacterium]|nr:GNAT family N-acetyltransferase [Longimicrobiales bacterium]